MTNFTNFVARPFFFSLGSTISSRFQIRSVLFDVLRLKLDKNRQTQEAFAWVKLKSDFS